MNSRRSKRGSAWSSPPVWPARSKLTPPGAIARCAPLPARRATCAELP